MPRRNAFDHVAARSAADHGGSGHLACPHHQCAEKAPESAGGTDILTLQRRYGFPLTISSGARSILEQRSVRETRGLCALFGMTGAEVSEALSSIGRLVEPARPVRVVG